MSASTILHNFLLAQYWLVITAIIINLILGLLYLRRAVNNRDFDMAAIIVLILYSVIMALIPTTHPWWNYLGITWIVLFFGVMSKLYFGDIVSKGTTKEKAYLVIGIALIILVVIFGQYIPVPDWFQYIPSI